MTHVTPRGRRKKEIRVERLTEEQKKELKIPAQPENKAPWAIWERGPSAFDWHYDHTEKCYLYEGDVKVITPHGEVTIKAGDFVTFPAGLKCRWEVHEKVRKVYKFE